MYKKSPTRTNGWGIRLNKEILSRFLLGWCAHKYDIKRGGQLLYPTLFTNKKYHPDGWYFLLVEMGGVEPPSESALTGTSPGA